MAGALAVDGPLVYLGGDIQRPVSALSNNMVRFNIKTILKSNFENFAESLANYVNVDLIVPSGGQVLVSGSFTDSIG